MSHVVSGSTAWQSAAKNPLPALAAPPDRYVASHCPGVPTRPQAVGPHQGSLLMVYGLNSNKMNAEKLFNLQCLYGNVVKITFLKNKNGCATVQMEDHPAKQRVVRHQNNAQFSNIKMQFGY
ncbi:hypothetical protein HPB47_012493 [Ixodes persulcatus]|uniref:Uncharacterized protein n=1 Tax=Ixodes persulcatus TaxID=34615 RepID=A0AC60NTE1_IXOPE|nr:hypothetical protein HPB47_012493 [Ixodes persulcatus]